MSVSKRLAFGGCLPTSIGGDSCRLGGHFDRLGHDLGLGHKHRMAGGHLGDFGAHPLRHVAHHGNIEGVVLSSIMDTEGESALSSLTNQRSLAIPL
jgi:hypothetical protein